MVTGHDLPTGVQPGAAPAPALIAAGVGSLAICAECRHAELIAVQPYARCLSADGPCAGRTVFAGQSACSAMTPCGDDLVLARCGLVRALKRGRDVRLTDAPYSLRETERDALITADAGHPFWRLRLRAPRRVA